MKIEISQTQVKVSQWLTVALMDTKETVICRVITSRVPGVYSHAVCYQFRGCNRHHFSEFSDFSDKIRYP